MISRIFSWQVAPVLAAGIFSSALSGCYYSGECNELDEQGRLSNACAVQRLDEEGVGEWAESRGAHVVRWPHRLEAGTEIVEGFDPQAQPILLQSDSWFFLADIRPGQDP